MAVISVSRRTDIPAFYTDWFLNRVKKGYVIVPSTFGNTRAFAVPLDNDYVDCFVFWTKNAKPLLDRIDELEGYTYYFQYTVNRYGRDIEESVPGSAADTFVELSEKIGKERVIWRYDPILLSERYSIDWHIHNFKGLAQKFSGHTEKCVISFIDLYAKTSRNTKGLGIRAPDETEMKSIAEQFSVIAEEFGIKLCSCCEKIDLSQYGIDHNSCIDGNLIERLSGKTRSYLLDNQREGCGCVKCTDIGMYDTCKHKCGYCYATVNHSAVDSFACNSLSNILNPEGLAIQSVYFEGKEIIDFDLWLKDRSDCNAYKEKPKKSKREQSPPGVITLDSFSD